MTIWKRAEDENFKMQTWFKIKTENSCITKLYENENGLL